MTPDQPTPPTTATIFVVVRHGEQADTDLAAAPTRELAELHRRSFHDAATLTIEERQGEPHPAWAELATKTV